MKRLYFLILATVLVASISFSQSKTQVVNAPNDSLKVKGIITIGGINTQNDTIAIHGVYFKEVAVVDSIQMTIPVAAHAAGAILANSATAGNVVWLKFLNVAAVASGNFRIEDMAVSSDSLCAFSGLLILNNDTTKFLKIADNA